MEFTRRDTKIIKGVAICLMLYHHLFAYPMKVVDGNIFISLYTFGETTLSTYIGQFGRICLPMFVFLSGYGTYLSSAKAKDMQSLVLKQMLGLYKSFWKVFFIFVPASVLFFGIRPAPVQRELIYNFLGLSYSFNKEWWFITPYVLLLILFPAVKRFIERENAGLFTDLFIVVLLNGFVQYVLPEIIKLDVFVFLGGSVFWEHIKVMLGLLPGFVTGCIFARYGILNEVKSRLGGRLLWCAAALVGMAALFYIHLYNYMLYDFINTAVFIVCITVLLPTKPGRLIGRVFEILGEESTFMWLTHSFFCYYWCQKLVFAPKYSPVIFLWLLALSFASAKALGLFWGLVGKAYGKVAGRSAAR